MPAEYNSELMTEGEYSYTYEEAGTYGYHCTPHPMMTGEVIVQE
jgi:plastocyanin